MSPPQTLNLVPNDPSLKDLLDLFRKDVFLTLNCHAIATIQSFNPTLQTATATINYKKTRFEFDSSSGAYLPVLLDYPIITDAPVYFPGGGGITLTFPVAKGDECLVCFNDRDLDNWFSGSSSSAVETGRLHSFSDAIILVGIRSKANVIQNFNPTDAEIQAGDVTITFRKGGGVFITNSIGNFRFEDNADVTFDTGTVQGLFGHGGHIKFKNATAELIKTLIDFVSAVATAQCASPGNPLVQPAFATITTELTSFLEP